MTDTSHPKLAEYVCHKHVRAMKIVRISEVVGDYGDRLLIGADDVMIAVPPQYMAKHHPQVGGYYVRYDDDYESFSPAGPFEAGYVQVTA